MGWRRPWVCRAQRPRREMVLSRLLILSPALCQAGAGGGALGPGEGEQEGEVRAGPRHRGRWDGAAATRRLSQSSVSGGRRRAGAVARLGGQEGPGTSQPRRLPPQSLVLTSPGRERMAEGLGEGLSQAGNGLRCLGQSVTPGPGDTGSRPAASPRAQPACLPDEIGRLASSCHPWEVPTCLIALSRLSGPARRPSSVSWCGSSHGLPRDVPAQKRGFLEAIGTGT